MTGAEGIETVSRIGLLTCLGAIYSNAQVECLTAALSNRTLGITKRSGSLGAKMKVLTKLSTLLLGLPLSVMLVWAQSTTGSLTGTVTDPSGAAVPGALIKVESATRGITRDTRSSDLGTYIVPLLPPGVYRVTVSQDGFRPVTQSGIDLSVDQVAKLDFSLQLGSVTDTVLVSSDAPLVDSETSALGQVVDRAKVDALPLNGRMTLRLVQLTPGVLNGVDATGQFGDISVGTFDDVNISINGARAGANATVIDGVPASTGFLNLFTAVPSVDVTQEFKVQSNATSAEFGRFGGGVINVSTRSGANDVHGNLFEFLRNNILNANDFFSNRSGIAAPAFRMNQFGAAVGGPVWIPKVYNGRNRTFFFMNYEGTRWRRGAVYQGTVPSLLERQGNFSQTLNTQGQLITIFDPTTTTANPAGGFIRAPFPGNVIPKSQINPIGAAIASYFPLPNMTGDLLTHTNNYFSNANTRVNKDNGAARIDHNITDKYRMFGRLDTTFTQLHQPDTFGNPATPGVGANGDIIFHYYTGVWDNTYIASPTTVFNLRYGFARFYWARSTRSYGFDQTSLGLPASYVSRLQIPVFPNIGTEGYAGMAGGSFIRTGQDTHSLLPSVLKSTSRHNLKVGADSRLRRNNIWIIQNGGGTFSFTRSMTTGPNPNVFSANAGNSIAALLLGAGSSGSVGSTPGASLQSWYLAGYVQDDIKVSRRLTLNFGLRYETESPYTERRNEMAWFDANAPSPITNPALPNLKGAVRYAGVSGNSRHPYTWDTNNFSPRVGLAWSATKRLVLRSGFGLFYAGLETDNDLNNYSPVVGTSFTGSTAYLGTLDGITPFNFISNPFPTGLTRPSGSSIGPASMLGQGITSWDYSGITPYTEQWNADVQYQLTQNLLIDVAYAGSHGIHFARTTDANALNPQYLSLQTKLNTLVPNPFYGQIAVGALSQPSVAYSQLLRPFPQYSGVSIVNAPTESSIYHSIQMKVEKRMSHGQSFLLALTGGKLISNGNNNLAGLGVQNNGTAVQNWYNLNGERSISEQDQSKALALSYVAELPFGKGYKLAPTGVPAAILGNWNISGMFTYTGGLPLVITAPISGGGNRPNSTGQSATLPGGRSHADDIAQWFNTSVFTLPPSYTYGNVSRTLPDTRGPSTTNFNLSLVRAIRFRDRADLQFRAEAFNLMNTPHFWLPATSMASLQFGQITSTQVAQLPRVLQFALKLKF
jgi:hypothetical protein